MGSVRRRSCGPDKPGPFLFSARRRRAAVPVVAIVVLSADWSQAHHTETTAGDTDRRIAFYSAKLAKDPNLYPVHAQLGRAYLDKAVETLDPQFVAKARESLDRSLRIQSSHDAYVGQLAVATYSHRFEDALRWGALARETSPTDTSVLAKIVEARLGLGQITEAAAVVDGMGLPAEDFFLAAARGHVLAARGMIDGAVAAFLRAADFARAQNVPKLVSWARVRTAATLLRAGRLDEAAVHLEAAEAAAGATADLMLQRGRLEELRDRWPEALATYELALKQSADPAIHARIAHAARQAGDADRARKSFDIAERAFRKVLDAGENYTLGALARLYLDAGVNLSEALDLARRNTTFVRDSESEATLAELEMRLRK